jgi:hypothetical protein
MAQALQAVGQGRQEEASDALLGRQDHDHALIPVAIIAPVEVDQPILQGHQALVADGHAMGRATQVGHDLLRRRKRGLGIDDPVLAPALRKPGLEGRACVQWRRPGRKAERPLRKRPCGTAQSPA